MKEIMNFFPELLRINMVASIVILVILVARLILKRAPKVFSYALWTIVLIRLLIPVSIPSQLSVVPDISAANSAVINAALPELEFETLRDREQNYYEDQKDPSGEAPKIYISHSMEPIAYLSIVWLAGMACMVVCSSFSYWKIKKKIRISFPVQGNILIADAIKSPFVIGFIRPKIYLPCNLGEKEQSYIILHEKHHIRRGDHIIKALAFLALTIHWFNPMVWIAFVLACRDMEMSCDEAVIRKVGSHVRADYSASLLTLATGRRIIAGTPLAFGEGDTKGRIHNLAKWKKPARWIVILSVVLCLILAVCLLTNPAKGMPLRKIEGRSNFKITNDETVIMNSFGLETEVIELEEFQKALSEIKVIRNPIDQSRSEDRDSSHQIILGDRFFLNFSWDYRTVWIDDLVKPSYTYTVSNPIEVAKIFRDYSDVGFNWGITLKAENVSPDGAKITMTQTGGYIQFRLMYGDDYHIEKNENGQWVNVESISSHIVRSIAYTVPQNDSVSWNINWAGLYGSLEPGMYRFCKTITDSFAPGDSDSVTFYAEFEICE